mmetsp:Transcript_34856/g.82245  ORF Transcript_34856/g.82245 Transcript_34856/m.82245 type:complete len:175 (-) Transcript_34856:1144-1668(-)
MSKYIELYVQKVNPMKAPQVAGALLDADCSEDFVRALILSVRSMTPTQQLVEDVENRNCQKPLQPWLEARVNEDVREAAVHKALMKIYIDMKNRPEKDLTTNIYYDSKVVGECCEKRGPQLSFLAYKRGMCDATNSSMSTTATGCTHDQGVCRPTGRTSSSNCSRRSYCRAAPS